MNPVVFVNAISTMNQNIKKGVRIASNPFSYLAGSMGLEPTASGVTGRRYNRLNYDPVPISFEFLINETLKASS